MLRGYQWSPQTCRGTPFFSKRNFELVNQRSFILCTSRSQNHLCVDLLQAECFLSNLSLNRLQAFHLVEILVEKFEGKIWRLHLGLQELNSYVELSDSQMHALDVVLYPVVVAGKLVFHFAESGKI